MPKTAAMVAGDLTKCAHSTHTREGVSFLRFPPFLVVCCRKPKRNPPISGLTKTEENEPIRGLIKMTLPPPSSTRVFRMWLSHPTQIGALVIAGWFPIITLPSTKARGPFRFNSKSKPIQANNQGVSDHTVDGRDPFRPT